MIFVTVFGQCLDGILVFVHVQALFGNGLCWVMIHQSHKLSSTGMDVVAMFVLTGELHSLAPRARRGSSNPKA